MSVQSMFGVLLLSLVSGAAHAIASNPVPEPGVIELLAIGGVAVVATAIRKRRK